VGIQEPCVAYNGVFTVDINIMNSFDPIELVYFPIGHSLALDPPVVQKDFLGLEGYVDAILP
jgi:hypothetical protein